MKKEYVKPVIESEEFVANEYVAACWHVSCPKEGSGLLDCHYQSWDIKGADSVEAYVDAHSSSGELIHKGTSGSDHNLGSENSSLYYHNTFVFGLHHQLNIISYEEYNSQHPNASV